MPAQLKHAGKLSILLQLAVVLCLVLLPLFVSLSTNGAIALLIASMSAALLFAWMDDRSFRRVGLAKQLSIQSTLVYSLVLGRCSG